MGLGRQHERNAAALRAERRPCWLCGQAIDYDAAWPDPQSFSADHVKPRSTHPHLATDPANLAAAHLGCNNARQDSAPAPAIGATSRTW